MQTIKITDRNVEYVGTLVNGLAPDGKGKLKYRDNHGRCYEGYFKNNMFHGKGQLYFPLGQIKYNGEFQNNMFHGEGILYNNNGNIIYNGTFQKNKYHGKGKLYYTSGNLHYDGEIQNGDFTGKGVLYYDIVGEKKEYEGDFKNDMFSGEGKLYYDTGQLHRKGTFIDGFMSVGESFYKSGNKKYQSISRNIGEMYYDSPDKIVRYKGGVKGGLKNLESHGQGELFFKTGILKYKGGFKNNEYDGKGELFFENGKLEYKGGVKDGQYDGQGEKFFENGKLYYKGGFKDGKLYGKGKLFSKNGILLYEGVFKNGVRQDKQVFKEFEFKKNNGNNRNTNKLSFNEIKTKIHELFGGKDIFEEWIKQFTPSKNSFDIHAVYNSIENIHSVFRAIEDITMNESKTEILSDQDIQFQISNSEVINYTFDDVILIIKKFANNLYKYLIRHHDMNKQKKTLRQKISKLFTKKITDNKDKEKKDKDKDKDGCFGIKYSKNIKNIINYSILDNSEGLIGNQPKLPEIIINKSYEPEEPKPDPEKPIMPVKKNDTDDQKIMAEYEKKLKRYEQIIEVNNRIRKQIAQYKENKAKYDKYPEVGDNSINVIRLIDSFVEKLPSLIQTEIARTYARDYITGYDLTTECNFDPSQNVSVNFLASCSLGNLKKLILSLYKVLVGYVDAKATEKTYIKNIINCDKDPKSEFRFTKLFYGSLNQPKEKFETDDNNKNEKNDKDNIKTLLNDWYRIYLELQRKEQSYSDFLNFIISQWYKTGQCNEYNKNENFIIYHFGYIWKTVLYNKSIVTTIDDKLAELQDNDDDNMKKTPSEKTNLCEDEIENIERVFLEIPEPCVLPDKFSIPKNMFKGVKIEFDDPIPEGREEGNGDDNIVLEDEEEGEQINPVPEHVVQLGTPDLDVLVGGRKHKKLKTKTRTRTNKKLKTKTYKTKK